MAGTSTFSCPDDWRVVPLRELAEVRFSSVDKHTHASEEPVRLCNYTDVYNNGYISGDLDFMHASATSSEIERFGVRTGDVIVTKDSETPDDIGIAAVVDSGLENLVCGYHLALIRPQLEKIDPTFLAKQLSQSRLTQYFGRQANGLTRYGLPLASVQNAPVWLPPIHEQKAIGALLRSVDEAIAKTEAVIAKLKRVRAGLLHDLLTRGIDENGELRDPVAHPEQFKESPFGKIPTDWDIRWLTELSTFQNGRSFPSACYRSSGVRLLRPGNLPASEFVEWNPKDTVCLPEEWTTFASNYMVRGGELIMNLTAQSLEEQFLGRVCMTSAEEFCVLNQRLARFRSLDCDLRFLFWSLRGPSFRKQIDRNPQGTKVQHIYNRDLQAVKLPVPRHGNEQQEIANLLFGWTHRLEAENCALQKLNSINAGLRTDLLTGRVRVPESIFAAEARA